MSDIAAIASANTSRRRAGAYLSPEDAPEPVPSPFRGVPNLVGAHEAADLIRNDPEVRTPFQARIERHMELDDTCRRFLRDLQRDPMVFRPGVDIHREGGDMSGIHVVQAGWLVGYTFTRGGSRHIYRIYQPGDMVGVEDMNWNYRTSSVGAVTHCTLTAFAKPTLRGVFEDSPTLARSIFAMTMMDQVQSFDELRATARLDAVARVASLVLRLHSRARAAGLLDRPDTIEIPLTQSQMGDAVGLTNVSVSRALAALVERGFLARRGSTLTILDERTLADMGDFTDRYAHVDTGWVRPDRSMADASA